MTSFLALPAANYGWIKNPFPLLVLVFLVLNEQVFEAQNWLPTHGYPWNTTVVMMLWLWCAWKWTRQRFDGRKPESAFVRLPIGPAEIEG